MSARTFHRDRAVTAGQVDLKMHATRDNLRDLSAMTPVLEPHDSEFGEALKRARQAAGVVASRLSNGQ